MQEKSKQKDYNWWTDPANAEMVKKVSWWDNEQNKTFIQIPVSIVEGDGYWIIGSNSDTEKLLGENSLPFSAQGDSRQDAIDKFFNLFRVVIEHDRYEIMKYKRWVPLRVGSWGTSWKWFVVYGLSFSFRYGEGMRGGWYIPFTKLNISLHNEWGKFNMFKKKQQS